MEITPKASGCLSGGAREIFSAVSEDSLGGDGKADVAKLPGVVILPKPPGKMIAEKENVSSQMRGRDGGGPMLYRWYLP